MFPGFSRWMGVWLLLMATACTAGDGPPRGDEGFAVDTLDDGRVRVVNFGPEWDDATRWTVAEDLRLGIREGEGPEQFGQISALKVDGEGRIYVLDYMSQDVRVFHPDGSYSHAIGSRGEGPGEFTGAAGLNWDAQGNLWVWDSGGRFSSFTPEGEFIDTRPRLVRGVVYPWRGEFDVDGSMIDWGLDYPGMRWVPNESPSRIIYYPVRFSGDFSEGDTLPTLSFDFEMGPDGEQRLVFGEGLSTFQDRNGAIWFARNKSFTLYRRTLAGDTTLETSIPATPARVTPHEIDSIQALYIDQGRPEQAPGPDQFAETRPMIRRIFSDEAGHIFVLSEQEGRPLGTFVDVFRDSGRYLGRIDLPVAVHFPYPPPAATESHLLYVTTDDFDVEYVVRLRLEKPSG